MRISESLINEIKSSDGHIGHFFVSESVHLMSRIDFIIQSIASLSIKNVVHVGCCGHEQKIDTQIKEKKHLHSSLISNFTNAIGFDTNQTAVEMLKNRGFKNIYCNDFLNAEYVKPLIRKHFGVSNFVILLPDVLEHIENPIEFLKSIKNNYKDICQNLIISVPNAYSYQRVARLFTSRTESVNLDHKYMFTPITILKAVIQADIIPKSIDFLGFFDDYPVKNNLTIMGHTIILSCIL